MEKQIEKINCSDYDFLLESNKNFMNYIALSFYNKKITFEELHENVKKYANALYKKGIRKGDKIALLLENSPEAVYLYYALGKIGAIRTGFSIYNNSYKMQRDFDLLKPQRIIAVNSMYGNIKDPCDALNISPILYSSKDFENEQIEVGADQNLREIISHGNNNETITSNFSSSDITDILFTGGSTGIHKGVELNSSGLNNVVKSLDNIFCLEPGMIHLGNIPFGHMIFGRFALHYSLTHNLEYALTLEGLPNKFLDEIIRTKANGAMGGPVHWNTIPNHPLLKKGCLSGLYQACTGGEMLKAEDEKKDNAAMEFAGSSAKLTNMLGLTEMSGATHINMPGRNTPGTIGSPISCVEDIIVEPKSLNGSETGNQVLLQEVKAGETGLLLTKGPGMLLGYHNNETETRKVFVFNQDGTKWYNTGDLVKRTGKENNETAFSGRLKRNFVCGYDNIYPEQIEGLLTSMPEIKEAVVTKVKDEKYQFLPSYHISLNSPDCDTKALKEKIDVLIESTLGAFALPGYIEFTTNPLPRNDDNGKLNASLLEQNDIEKLQTNTLILTRKVY